MRELEAPRDTWLKFVKAKDSDKNGLIDLSEMKAALVGQSAKTQKLVLGAHLDHGSTLLHSDPGAAEVLRPRLIQQGRARQCKPARDARSR